MIFETHAHYDDEKFDEDRAELLSSMQENGIGRIINVSANLESLENTRKLMEAYPFIYGAFGLHPDEVGDLNEDGTRNVHFELNGMRREVAVPDKNAEAQVKHVTLADPSDKSQAGASIPGMVSKICVKLGDAVEENQVLAVIEAMKMETNVVARMAGTVEQVLIKEGGSVKAGELLITIK